MHPSLHGRRARLSLRGSAAILGAAFAAATALVAPGGVSAAPSAASLQPRAVHHSGSAPKTGSRAADSKHNLLLHGEAAASSSTLRTSTALQPRSLSGPGTVTGSVFTLYTTLRNAVASASVSIDTDRTGNGTWELDANGTLKPSGDAAYFGSGAGFPGCGNWVGIASDPAADGYWLASDLGCVVAAANAPLKGDAFDIATGFIVGIRATSSGNGYWLVDEFGRVIPFGDAGFFGDTHAVRLNRPITAMEPTASGNGYWLVASDGGIFPFGDAGGYGSAGNIQTNGAIIDLHRSATGNGYLLTSSRGTVYHYGDAVNYGDQTGQGHLILGMAPSHDRQGYWLLRYNGQSFPEGDAPNTVTGTTNTVLSSFFSTDSNATAADFTATVNWGDGTVVGAAIFGGGGGFVVTAPPHTYGGVGYWPLTVHLTSTAGDDLVGKAFQVIEPASGYWLVASDGGIFPFGDMPGLGSTGNIHLNQPIVGMARTPTGLGYWLVASDGGIFPFGDAAGYGSTGNVHLNQPIVGMAATWDGAGYWLVAADGGIFPFGDATGYGSTGNMHLNKPIVGMAATPDGGGYWLVASDGGIFPFGDAPGLGSTGNIHLNKPIVGMAVTPDGGGYWMVASDGGIFPFGDAPGLGSTGGMHLNQPIVGMTSTADGQGYWLDASDGGIFPFGDATGFGSTGNIHLNKPMVGMAGY